MIPKITKIGSIVMRIMVAIVVVILATYAIFTLWDMYRTEIRAFASYDLLKYRPNIEEDEPPYLDELIKINPDTAAWVTIYGTNIDYPVMQGKTDMEYVSKSPLGKFSPTGSIFLSTLNKKDFSDPYNLIYGHHLQNGSMFGDIDKFLNKNYFHNIRNCRYEHDEGVLIMEEKVYNLKVFAIMETDAYNWEIYHADKKQEDISEFLSYVKENAKYWRDVGETDKVLAMSTCENNTTNGRFVLLCQMKKRTEPLPTREAEPLTPHRKAIGHNMAGAYWALLNMLIMVLTLYVAFPVHLMVQNLKRKEEDFSDAPLGKRKTVFEYVALVILSIGSIVLFYLTEDPHQAMRLIDKWTIPMILILFAVWFIRCRCSGMNLKQIFGRNK